jgi:nicotinate-nucleotide adenylyltransferase
MLGIFGGSFDPPHFGHIRSVMGLLENFDFQEIRLIPCQLSPHKDSVHASAAHRWQMLSLLCANHEKLIADDRELKHQTSSYISPDAPSSTPSYTIDTLLELRKEYGEKQSLVLIIGMDTFLAFCKWRRYEEILSLCHILLLQRPGYSLDDGQLGECEKIYFDSNNTKDIEILSSHPCGKIYESELKEVNVSSTVIRKSISEGQSPKFMLPGNIWNYIRRNKLYK